MLRRWFWIAWVVPVLTAFAQEPGETQSTIDEELTVSRRVVDVRVIDVWGRPVLGLEAKDFRLTHRGKPIPVLTCEWVDDLAPRPQQNPLTEGSSPPLGRLIVLFFQVELEASRVLGLRTKIAQAFDAIPDLGPHDYVAVVSYDSSLRLRCDFTRSEAEVGHALTAAFRRHREPFAKASARWSLGKYLTAENGRDATTPEKGLYHIGKALQHFEQTKILIYLGFGPADFWRGNVELREDYPEAVQALKDARVTVMSLDFAAWEYDTSALGMRKFALDTGGFFLKSPRFVQMASNKLNRSISGYYILSHDPPENPEARLKLRLAGRKKGRVLAKSPYY